MLNTYPQPNEPTFATKPKTNWLAIFLSVIITALIVGGGVYALQKVSYDQKVANLKNQIQSLQNQIGQKTTANQQGAGEQDNLSDWQTYRNEEYGYEIKYSSNWNFENEKSVVDSVNQIVSNVTIKKRDGQILYIMVDTNKPSEFIYDAPIKTNLKINNIDSVAYIFPNGYECYEEIASKLKDCSFFTIPIKHNNYWYNIRFSGDSETISPEQSQIISTFKFIK